MRSPSTNRAGTMPDPPGPHGWAVGDFNIGLHAPGKGQRVQVPAGSAAVVWIVSGAAVTEQHMSDGTRRALPLRQGEFGLYTASAPGEIRVTGAPACQAMHVRLGPLMLRSALRDGARGDGKRISLRTVAAVQDRTLGTLLELLLAPLDDGAAPCDSFLRGLGHALAAHLVRRYAMSFHGLSMQQGLPAYKLELVLRMMTEKLAEPFDLAALARRAGLSVCHFSRAFKVATGVPPSRYAARLRIDEAERLLARSDQAVIDIALALGYRSPSHFSKIFREATGMTPSAYRAQHG